VRIEIQNDFFCLTNEYTRYGRINLLIAIVMLNEIHTRCNRENRDISRCFGGCVWLRTNCSRIKIYAMMNRKVLFFHNSSYLL
jgi:hypothetical protein